MITVCRARVCARIGANVETFSHASFVAPCPIPMPIIESATCPGFQPGLFFALRPPEKTKAASDTTLFTRPLPDPLVFLGKAHYFATDAVRARLEMECGVELGEGGHTSDSWGVPFVFGDWRCFNMQLFLHYSQWFALRQWWQSVFPAGCRLCPRSRCCAEYGTGDGLLGLVALVQVAATLPDNYIAFEYPTGKPEWWYDIVEGLPNPIVKDSYIDVWDRPGMGVNLIPEAAKPYLSEGDETFFDYGG